MQYDLLLTNSKELVQVHSAIVKKVAGPAMPELPVLSNAFLAVKNQKISSFGFMKHIPVDFKSAETINAATINTAHALELSDSHVSITEVKTAIFLLQRP
jgi:hypothetical protein